MGVTHSFLHSSIHSFIPPSIHSSIHSFIPSLIHSFIPPFIRPLIFFSNTFFYFFNYFIFFPSLPSNPPPPHTSPLLSSMAPFTDLQPHAYFRAKSSKNSSSDSQTLEKQQCERLYVMCAGHTAWLAFMCLVHATWIAFRPFC